MKTYIVALLAGALLVPAAAADADAQQRQQRQGQQQGPAFCRNGEGHPVHGRSWCIQKGFGLGGSVIWRQSRWDGAVLRGDRRSGELNRAGLGTVLGDILLGRLDGQRRQLRATAPLTGRWLPAENGGAVLQVRSGRTVVAELVDWQGNGRVDLVLLNGGRR